MPSSNSSRSTVQGKHHAGSTTSLTGTSGGGGAHLSSSSSTRQQARLGVTLDYTDLSLHHACATENIGESSLSYRLNGRGGPEGC